MGEFPKSSRVSARVHPSIKKMIDESRYNAAELLEYAIRERTNEKKIMEIEEYFLIKEIDDMKYELIVKEKRLDDLQKLKKAMYGDDLSELQLNSYQKIISMYSEYSEQFKNKYDEANYSLEQFIQLKGIQQNIIGDLAILDCPMDKYVEGLLDYYQDVRHASQTI